MAYQVGTTKFELEFIKSTAVRPRTRNNKLCNDLLQAGFGMKHITSIIWNEDTSCWVITTTEDTAQT